MKKVFAALIFFCLSAFSFSQDLPKQRRVNICAPLHSYDMNPHTAAFTAEAQLFAIQEEFTLGGLDSTGEALNQSRLTGTVLTQKGMDSAAVEGDTHIIQRQAAGILLGNMLGVQNAH